MFQSHSEKGLFTFYWEQAHPAAKIKEQVKENTAQEGKVNKNIVKTKRSQEKVTYE